MLWSNSLRKTKRSYSLSIIIKATLINIFNNTVRRITSDVKVITPCDKPAENNRPTADSHSVTEHFRIFQLLVWFCSPELYCFGSHSHLSSTLFSAAAVFSKTPLINSQTDIFFRNWWKPKQRYCLLTFLKVVIHPVVWTVFFHSGENQLMLL